MGWSVPRRIGRPGVVTSTGSAASRSVSAEPRRSRPALGEGGVDGRPDAVGDGPDPWSVVGRQCADPAQDAGQAALLAQDVELERLEGRRRRGSRRRTASASSRRASRSRVRSARSTSVLPWPRESGALDRQRRRGLIVGVAVGSSAGRVRRPWRARRSGRRWPRRGWRGRPGSCDRSGHVGLLEAADELAVGEAVLAGRRVDADDPQLAHLALALLAVAGRVGERVEQGLAGRLDQLATWCPCGPRRPGGGACGACGP